MNVQAVVDHLQPLLALKGWQTVREADALEPDHELDSEAPAAYVFPGPIRPYGDSPYDNFTAQTTREHIGIWVVCDRSELGQRLQELSDALLGHVLTPYSADPNDGFAIQYAEGKPVSLGRDVHWWLEMYFTESQRRQLT